MTDSISSDRAFIPFNLSSVAPLDALAAALSELPVAQPREPAGEFSSFLQYEVPTSTPAPDTEMEMIRLIRNTAREGYVCPACIFISPPSMHSHYMFC